MSALIVKISVHGVYSLTFLELWSLAQGSYSLAILQSFGGPTIGSHAEQLTTLEALGGQKRDSRLRDLIALGLVRGQADTLHLSPHGRLAALPLRLVHLLANVRFDSSLRSPDVAE